MNKMILLAAPMACALCSSAFAQDLDPDTVNKAELAAVAPERPAETSEQPDPAIIKLQILLDRAGASPGVIDGFYGENVTKAIAGFEAVQRLPVDGKPDPEMLARLQSDQPVIQSYRITEDDPKDLVERIPEDYAEQAKMDHLGYTSMAEKLAERFHMDEDLIHTLNPSATFAAGETVAVAIPDGPRQGAVKRIEAHRKNGTVVAFAEDASILAVYPATIGSDDNPSPTGTHKVNGVARNPPYTYNPKVNFQQGNNKKIMELPSGPNNPVGTVWIDLSEPTYGIHGTPAPSLIDKAGSHGCIRLTNWDVEELAGMVKPGVVVEFVD